MIAMETLINMLFTIENSVGQAVVDTMRDCSCLVTLASRYAVAFPLDNGIVTGTDIHSGFIVDTQTAVVTAAIALADGPARVHATLGLDSTSGDVDRSTAPMVTTANTRSAEGT